jgi:hypothetical protein
VKMYRNAVESSPTLDGNNTSLAASKRDANAAPRFMSSVVFTPEGHFLITEVTPAVEQLVELCSVPLREVPSRA